MNYQVIARKFRPQVFEDVVGQNPIVQTLRNAIEMERIGHAYLFSGPRGVGKTTMARLLAKALNCAGGPTATPCNECASCQEVTAGRSIDVLEIDAASNTGVDSIRELRENARYAPSRDRFKIFIVDEVHMLSTAAFNALLKTLEEPPDHIAFIMATTERHKLPATILSRCQQFVFRSIPPAEIHAHLRNIASREGMGLGDGALDHIVRAAGGSMRDAQSLLDQIIAFGGQEISDDEVRSVLGFVPAELLSETLDALAARDAAGLIRIVGIASEQGLHLQQFVKELLGEIRNLLVTRLGLPERVPGTREDQARLASLAERFSEQDLIRFFDVLFQVEGDLRWASEPRFYLEMACVKLTELGRLRELEDVIRDLRNTGLSPPQAKAISASAPARPRRERSPAQAQREPAVPERPVAPPPPDQAPLPPEPTSAVDRSAREAEREAAREEPMVRSFLDVFRGEIAHVKTRTPGKPEDGS
jgi:DNA polymerase-3 subunit gamma/tau